MKYHKTWWGESFVSALEGFIDRGRLQRGRAYRTDNRVLKFDQKANNIKATIRGNINLYFGVTEEPRYRVIMTFKTIPPKAWDLAIEKIGNNAAWLSKLMLNEIPSDIDEAFEKNNLLPKSYNDVEASCTCPDYDNPCKHIAGIYYRLANRLDSNPMMLFSLKGIEPEALRNALKKTELGQAFAEHLSTPDNLTLEHSLFLYPEINTSQVMPSTSTQENFWGLKPFEKEEKSNELESPITAALIKKQGDHPPFWHRHNSFISLMENFYETTKRKNKKAL